MMDEEKKIKLLKELQRIYTIYDIEKFTDMTEETEIIFKSGEKMKMPRHVTDIKYAIKELKANG